MSQNLWPNKSEIILPKEYLPEYILKEQAKYLEDMFPELKVDVSFELRYPFAKTMYILFTISNKNNNFKFRLLELRIINENYLYELSDLVNYTEFNIVSKDNFESRLKEIFNSDKVKKKLENIIVTKSV